MAAYRRQRRETQESLAPPSGTLGVHTVTHPPVESIILMKVVDVWNRFRGRQLTVQLTEKNI